MITALTMFTAVPVPAAWHRRAVSPRVVLWLPLLGGALGAVAGLVVALVLWRAPGAGLPAAVLAVATLALLTRGLHLDGLADTADGLGSRAEPRRALEIMRRSDIGPFGVVTLVLLVVADVAALSALAGAGRWVPLAALVTAAATGRLAVVHACLPGVPSARPDGFGALVAGRTPATAAAVLTAATLALGAACAALADAPIAGWVVAQVVALGVAALFRAHTTRRLGGVTGDVFGALVELATALTLVGFIVS
ncbi:MAG: adenosylcobinamide-GDP ribazoletransferase [Jatrophihabitans sp.]|uniref:adenosylcobinamide-GDP ribazoletransferase n=1 Tax=Jatrophihabitans sp. TaxID=1932789 RepID=UPI003F7D25EA